MKRIYFCRHGESELNASGHWAGHTETPLTANGRVQAKTAGEATKKLGIDYIICSPLSRAHDTAKIIAAAIGYPEHQLEINSLVIERHFGSLEGQIWQPDLNLDGFAGVETHDSIVNRARLLVEHMQTIEADTILVVSHGAFGRALRHVLNPKIPVYGPGTTSFENAKIVKLL